MSECERRVIFSLAYIYEVYMHHCCDVTSREMTLESLNFPGFTSVANRFSANIIVARYKNFLQEKRPKEVRGIVKNKQIDFPK